MSHTIRLLLLLLSALLIGCESTEDPPPPAGPPDTLTLNFISDKSVVLGDQLTFPVTATDPDGLQTFLTSVVAAGSIADLYNLATNEAIFSTTSGSNTGNFNWPTTAGTTTGDYYANFLVMNTAGESDNQVIKISVLGQFALGEATYNRVTNGNSCQGCHGTGGRGGIVTGLLECMDEATYDEKIGPVDKDKPGSGTMNSYVSGWSTAEKAAVIYYLRNVGANPCL